jgi:hypothetical protein
MAIAELETYIELLSSGVAKNLEDTWNCSGVYPGPIGNVPEVATYNESGPSFDWTYLSTFRPLNPANYDGTCAYTFEIVCRNRSREHDATIYLVDENGNVYTTRVVPKNTDGPIEAGIYEENEGWDLFRFSDSFTPIAGDHQYGLCVTLPNTGQMATWSNFCTVTITEATIVIHQINATKSSAHIPMYCNADDSDMWYDHNYDAGVAWKSTGTESLATAISGIATYADCEVIDDISSQSRQIFKYSTSEFATVDNIVFDAAAGYLENNTNYSDLVEYQGTLTSLKIAVWYAIAPTASSGVSVDTGLGWTTADLSYDCTGMTPTGNKTFYYVENSLIEWTEAGDGHPFVKTVEIDPAEVNLGVAPDSVLWLGYIRNGDATLHFQKLRAFGGYSNPASRVRFKIEVYDSTTKGGVSCKTTFRFTTPTAANALSLIIHDVTDNVDITESELNWNMSSAWARKTVSLAPALFTTEHEYIIRWKSTGASIAPRIVDANLSIFVTSLSKFMSYRRVAKNCVQYVGGGYSYVAWGTPDPARDSGYGGVIDVMARAKLYLAVGLPVYFEECASEYSGAGADGSYQFASLWDCGTDDNSIGTGTSTEIGASRLTWTTPGSGVTERKRTSALTGLTDQNRYVVYQPDSYDYFYPTEGFLLVQYSGDSGGGGTSPTGFQRTLVHAFHLMEGRGGWFSDVYSPSVVVHYGDEGSGVHRVLCGTDGTIFSLSGDTDNGAAIACKVCTGSRDHGDSRYQKLYGDIMLDANTGGQNLTATPGFNNHSATGTVTTVNNAVRTQTPFDVVATKWYTARNISLDLAWNSTTPSYLYSWEPRWTEEGGKLLAYSWETCHIAHEQEGFLYLGDLYLVHISTADLSLVITIDEVAQPALTIAHSAGLHKKTYLRMPVMKGKLFKYRLTSTAQFKVEGGDSELRLKPWGKGGPWQVQRLFQENVTGGDAA